MFSFLFFLLFGLIVGLIARAIMPGDQKMGWLATAAIGIAGSFVGGMLSTLISGGKLGELQTSGWIGSIIGALLVMIVVAKFRGDRKTA